MRLSVLTLFIVLPAVAYAAAFPGQGPGVQSPPGGRRDCNQGQACGGSSGGSNSDPEPGDYSDPSCNSDSQSGGYSGPNCGSGG